MKAYWENLDPKVRRWAVAVLVAVGFGVVFSLASPEPEKKGNRRDRPTIERVLTDSDTREAGLDSLGAKVDQQKDEQSRLKKELERVQRDLEKLKTQKSDDLAKKVSELERRLAEQEKPAVRERPKEDAPPKSGPTSGADPKTPAPGTASPQSGGAVSEAKDGDLPGPTSAPEEFFQEAKLPDPGKGAGKTGPAPKIALRTIGGEGSGKKNDAKGGGAKGKKDESIYLPPGSLLSGVLINGFDAPTGLQARNDPLPVTLRIKKEAILPNRFTADVRECFVILAGYGDLSSRRAYIRSESISCVRNDGKVIEGRLDAYAIGEDGKAGVRGRFVSKSGELLSKGAWAGFLEGMSSAFDVTPIPTLSTTPTGTVNYQQVFSKELMQSAALNGAGKALERIANYYVELAESIFPVIEIDALREVDLSLTHGVRLNLQ